VYSTNPANDTLASMTGNFRRFSCTYGGSCPALGSGNGFLYSYTPTLTATPSAIGLTYGAAVPSLAGYAYGLSGYLGSDAGSDNVTGSLTGTTTYTQGSNVGSYNVNYSSGSLASAMGYGFSYANNANAITVGVRSLSVSADAKSKTYGAADPALTYQLTSGSFYGSDSFSGSLSRAAGETVAGGPYAIGQGTLSAGSNYSISYTGANFTINPYTLSVAADDKSKTYGDSDPSLTYTYGTLQNGDGAGVFSGALSRAAGETVAGGPYAIGQGTLSAGSNYSISYTGANLTINPHTLSVAADAKSKIVGAADPTLTYAHGALQNGDGEGVFSGGLSRVAGETVAGGPYAITLGTLSAGSNYSISYTGNFLTITEELASSINTSLIADIAARTWPVQREEAEIKKPSLMIEFCSAPDSCVAL
jgi:hypothetical protein